MVLVWNRSKNRPRVCRTKRERFVFFPKELKRALHQSSSSFIVQRECARMAFLESIEVHTEGHVFAGFCRSELKGHMLLPHSSLPFEDKSTRRLWGISFAQMSSLIQRWMVTFEGLGSWSLWSYVQSLGLPQSLFFIIIGIQTSSQEWCFKLASHALLSPRTQ